jgi:hypothetical protein
MDRPSSRSARTRSWPAIALASVLALAGCTGPIPPAPSASPSLTAKPEPATILERITLPAGPAATVEAGTAIAAFGAIWVLELDQPHGWLIRVDPTTRAIARYAVGTFPGSIAAGTDSIWVANGVGAASAQSSGGDTVLRFDPSTGHVTASITAQVGGPIAAGFGAVFVPGPDSSTGPLQRIDATSGALSGSFPLGGSPAVACGGLWLAQTFLGPTLPNPTIITRLDPATGQQEARWVMAEGSRAPAEADGHCLAVAGPNYPTTPTQSTIALIDPAKGVISRSAVLPHQTAVLLGTVWARDPSGGLQRIDVNGHPIGPAIRIPDPSMANGDWTVLKLDGAIWAVGSQTLDRLELPGCGTPVMAGVC